MKLDQAVKYFGSQTKVAEVLGLSDAAVSVWTKRNGGLIPMRHIVRLKDTSNGELDLNLADYR